MKKNKITAHPGDMLMDEINTRGFKKMAFARQLQISNSLFSDIIRGKRGITEAVAKKLEQHLDIPVEIWMKAQQNYDYCHSIMAPVECIQKCNSLY
ncbi:MAG: HigA family addiction module antitoxin [Chitinophagaceae bacterium]